MIRTNIESALVAGLSLIFPLFFLMKWEAEYYGTGSFPDSKDIFNLSLIQTSYLASAFSIWLFRKHYLARKIPNWILVSIIGSLFLAVAYGVSQVVFGKLILSRSLEAAFYIFLIFSVYTLPFTALAHYSGALITSIKRWNHGSEPKPSILGKRRVW